MPNTISPERAPSSAAATGIAEDPVSAAHHAERRTRAVALLTAATMVAEIAAGWWFNSMALLADGWHMGTHAAAIGLSAGAYAWARRCQGDTSFAYGPWKIEMLAAFTSALALLAAALAIAWASITRLSQPQPIGYVEAMVVAAVGLVVNLVCAWMLEARVGAVAQDGHRAEPSRADAGHAHAQQGHHVQHAHHGHGHGHGHGRSDGHADLNLRSAYLHVLADAATSALAIVALAGGLWLGWAWLDPAVGLVGAVMVARWGLGLLADTSRVLLDREMAHPFVAEVRQSLEEHAPWGTRTRIISLRARRVGHAEWALVLHLVTEDPGLTVQRVRSHLCQAWPGIVLLTVQIEAA